MLDNTIDNKKLDLELTIGQLKKEKEKLSQSLKRRKDCVVQMNENLYIEERIEDIFLERNSDEVMKKSKIYLKKITIFKKNLER